ncbi:DUF4129 domain-containing protein [Microbacterium sp.]|uniref:DUF4129 domain-containing protein n=1 Tax=Microbacterium sp. TaxID=51671 RepID=UPI003C7902F1
MTDQGHQRGSDPRGTLLGGSRRALTTGGALLLFAVAMLGVAVAGRPVIDLPSSTPPPLSALPTPTRSDSAAGGIPSQRDAPDVALRIIGIILVLIVVTLIAAGLVLLVRALIRAWKDRPLRRQDAVDVDLDLAVEASAEPVPDAPAVRRGIAAARDAITRRIDPGEAIIAAWLGLEETASDAGAGRGTSETPAEFTLRILRHRQGIDGPTNRLLRLYEGVRFGRHAASESDRTAAADALAAIEDVWR